MAGRRPKPTALRLVVNASKRPIRDPNPTPPIGCDKPTFLKGRASGVWDRLAPRLISAGVLTELDGDMLAAYCLLVAGMEEDPVNFRKFATLRQFAACFGLDPTSRSRIYIAGTTPNFNAVDQPTGPRTRYEA